MNKQIYNNQSINENKIKDKANRHFRPSLTLGGYSIIKNKALLFSVILSGLLVLSACSPAVTTDSDSDPDNGQPEMNTTENTAVSDSDSAKTDMTNEPDDTENLSEADEDEANNNEEETENRTDADQAGTGLYQRISPADAKAWLESDDPPLLLDVRTQEENLAIRIPKSFLIPIDVLEQRLEDLPDNKDEPIIIYCRSGNRSAVAARILLEAGFTHVYDLGGIMAWPYQTTFG